MNSTESAAHPHLSQSPLNRPPRILVSGASGVVGYGILKCLRKAHRPLKLIGTSIHQDSVAPAFCDEFHQPPRTDDPSYLPWLLDLIETLHIDLMIPGIEADVHLWSRHREQIAQAGARAVLNSSHLIEITRDKWNFYRALEDAHSPYRIPTSLDSSWDKASAEFGTNLILKPRSGYGSRGLVRIQSRDQWESLQQRIGTDLLVQPRIGLDDSEYTTAIYGDGMGHSMASITLRRVLSSEGFTEKAQPVSSEPFEQAIQHLCALFRPIGPTNLQFRLIKDHPYLLEINPRLSSSASIRCAFGYNEPAMAVDHFLDGALPQQPLLRSGRAIRFWEDCVFMDPPSECGSFALPRL